MNQINELILKAKDLIVKSNKILVFSGAGLSTESGIPDFRSPGGLWSKYNPSDFYFQKIITDVNARKKYWQMSSEMWEQMRGARPNKGHLSIKKLEDMGKLLGIVTQNIDNLHHKAGNTPDKIIEIHGTAVSVSCLSCGKKWPRDTIHERVKAGELDPRCDRCEGILKPDTISFGQAMPQDKMARAFRLAEECDLCLVLGSSLVVYPAADIPFHAARRGARIMIVNRDPTSLDGMAEVVIHESIGQTMESVLEGV